MKGEIYIPRGIKYNYNDYHKEVDGVLYKKCNKHYTYFPTEDPYMPCTKEYFYKNDKNTKDELCPECKSCSKAKTTQGYYNNHEERKAVKRQHRLNNLEIYNTRAKQWQQDNKEKWDAYEEEYRKINPEKFVRYNEARQHKNHKITSSEWENCKRYFNYQCAYCGLHISEHYFTRKGVTKLGDFHKEHKDHEGVDGLTNCVPSCGSCNDRKWKFAFDEWYNESNPRFSEERLKKIFKWLTEDCLEYIEEHKPKRIYKKSK